MGVILNLFTSVVPLHYKNIEIIIEKKANNCRCVGLPIRIQTVRVLL